MRNAERFHIFSKYLKKSLSHIYILEYNNIGIKNYVFVAKVDNMVEQKKYGEILLKLINQTKNEQIKTSEQLIEALITELTASSKYS